MPFVPEIVSFINEELRAGSLNKERLQPQALFGVSKTVFRKKTDGSLEQFPAAVSAESGKAIPITPDARFAIQLYHRIVGNSYNYEKKSYGNAYQIKSTTDMQLVVITNSKITRRTQEVIEPVIIFGLPQRLSPDLLAELNVAVGNITPVSSSIDTMSVFKQEFPQMDFFMNDQTGVFSVRYKIDLTFSQACVDACLCN